jgi:hypothetical protein
VKSMMGERQVGQDALFYAFSLAGSRHRELPAVAPQELSARAAVGVARSIVGEVVTREGASVRLDLSNTGICGSIPRSLTNQSSISAEP